MDYAQTPPETRDVGLYGAKGAHPISGGLYNAVISHDQTTARITVEQTEAFCPLGFLTLEQGGNKIGLELTPWLCDALMNYLADVATIQQNRMEGRM